MLKAVGPVPFADLQAMIGKAETALEAFTPAVTTSKVVLMQLQPLIKKSA
jgi:hypothetical protein